MTRLFGTDGVRGEANSFLTAELALALAEAAASALTEPGGDTRPLAVVGAVVLVLGCFGWALEPSVAEPSDYDPPAEGGPAKELEHVG